MTQVNPSAVPSSLAPLLRSQSEQGTQYRQHDGRAWQEILDQAQAVEAAALAPADEAAASGRAPAMPTPRLAPAVYAARPLEADAAAASQGGTTLPSQGVIAARTSAASASALPMPLASWSPTTERAVEPQAIGDTYAHEHGPASDAASGTAEPGMAASEGAALSARWVRGADGALQLYLRGAQLSRSQALAIAARLKVPGHLAWLSLQSVHLNGQAIHERRAGHILFTG